MSSSSNAIATPARAQWALRQRLSAFLRWWTGELGALLPAKWRELSSLGGGGPLVSLREDELIVHEMRLGRLAELDRVRLSGLDPAGQRLALTNLLEQGRGGGSAQSVRLCLDGTQCLSKRIRLPLATEENLREVLGFEMDRHTPFKAEQVYFDHRIVKRDAVQGSIDIELTLAPKPAVDALIARIEALGGRVASAVCADDLQKPAPHPDLLRQTHRARAADSPARNLNLALAVVFVLMSGVAVAIPIWQKRAAAITLLPQLGKAKSEADAAEAVHRELEKLAAENNYILTRKYAQPSALSLIEDLSRVLPDTTWVQILEIKSGAKGREAVMTGETASSSKLVETVEQTGSLQNASFRSPLTKGQSPNGERFVLGAEVKTKPLPAPIEEADLVASAPRPAMPAPAMPSVSAATPAKPAGRPAAAPAPQAPAAQVPATAAKPGEDKPAVITPTAPALPSGAPAPASKN
jgi:general secretion pathway protein L